MRKLIVIAMVAAFALMAAPTAVAELQNVTIDGSIRIRANYYDNLVPGGSGFGTVQNIPNAFFPGRPLGLGLATITAFDDDESVPLDFIEQRTRLGFTADFTNEVSAYIEFDVYDIWGTDFRSDYYTGFDFNSNQFVGPVGTGVSQPGGTDDVRLYQAYIEANEMGGYPLMLRVGRQEMSLGSEWLVGVNNASSFFNGLSFDAVRLSYATDTFSVDAFAATLLEEAFGFEADGDVFLYGIYGSYYGIEDITIDAYWLFHRDARALNDTNFTFIGEWIEDVFNVDDYDVTTLHTLGLRGAGTVGQFDFEVEGAYQFGDVDQYGILYRFPGSTYGDDDADHGEFGFTASAGYTFDMNYAPRVWLGFTYFSGEDDRDISFAEWINPFDRPEASTSFNRLFSNVEYSEFIENTAMSNIWIINGGVDVQLTESVASSLYLAYFNAVEPFDLPVSVNIGDYRVPVAPFFSFWTEESDESIGFEVGWYTTYNYTEDLMFEVGISHFFAGEGIEDGNFVAANGQGFLQGSSDDGATYVYLETMLSF